MIEAAERDGRLKPGGTVVEATAGNTGLGLALVARAKGYRVVLVVPDKMSTEKVLHLKALGAEVHMTRSDVGKGHPEYYQDYAARLAQRDPRRVLRRPVQQPRQSARARDAPPARRSGQQMRPRARRDRRRRRLRRHAHRPDALLPRACSRSSSSCWPIRRARSCADYVRTGTARRRRLVGGRGHRRGLHPADRRPVARVSTAYSITDDESFGTARELLQAPKASSAARRPARCSPPRCATAASRPSRSASSPSSATPARATCRRSTTTPG